MESALTLAKKKNPPSAGESEENYEDRMLWTAYLNLNKKKHLTKKEREEHEELGRQYHAWHLTHGGYLPMQTVDTDVREAIIRLHGKLSVEFGEMTPLKTLLLDRLLSAWNTALSYDRMFAALKYKMDGSSLTISPNHERTKLLKEIRRGMESANEQIVRLSQALQNLCSPPIVIKAAQAFIAQNQQVNQSVSPKDFAEVSVVPHASAYP